MALPANVSFGTVTGRFLTATADSPTDTDRDPEGNPATDLSIRFAPNVTPAVVRDASSNPPTIFALAEVPASVNPSGDLIGADGQPGIRLVATTGTSIDPSGWTWKVTLSSPTFPALAFSFSLDPGQTIDLATVVQVPASPGTTLAAWLQAVADANAARVAAEAAADRAEAAAAQGGAGGGGTYLAHDAQTIDLCATPYSVTPGDDITEELQAAIDTIAASGQSGKVLISKIGTYYLNGPLQTGSYTGSAGTGDRQGGSLTHTWNAQILFPAVPFDNAPAPVIAIEGGVEPSVGWKFTGDAQGVQIVSNITSGKMFEAASGFDGWGKTWTGIMPVFRNLILRMPDNPTAGAIDIQHTLRTRIERVAVLTHTAWVVPVAGNISADVAIALPSYYENGDVSIRDVNVRGFPTAFRISEHAIFDNVQIVGCQIAFICGDGGHTNYFGNVDVEEVRTIFYLEPTIRITLGVYGYIDQEQNGLWPTMNLVEDPGDTGLISGTIDLVVGVEGSLGLAKPSGGALNTLGLLQVRNVNYNHIAGWASEHPVDTFARNSGHGATGSTGGAPGYSWPTMHPWRAQSGDFTIPDSNPVNSGKSVLRMTSGYSAAAVLPVKDGDVGGLQRSIEATFTPAATGTISFGILGSRSFNNDSSVFLAVFGDTLQLGLGTYHSQGVPLAAAGVVTPGQPVTLRLELYYGGNGQPALAKAYADGVLKLTRPITAAEAAANLAPGVYLPYLEDGVIFADNDNVSALSSFVVRDLPNPISPTRDYLAARVGTSNGSSTAFTGAQGFSIVPLNIVDFDTADRFDTTTGLYTIPTTGYWQIESAIRPVDGQSVRQIGIGVDTSNGDSATFAWLETNTNRTTLLYSRIGHFTAGDQVRLFIYADASGTTNFNTAALTLALLGT